jgi:nucleotide-binding universal stress UspA family protein
MARRIVAAIDSSPASRAALKWAFGEATRTGEDLLAVHVVEPIAQPQELTEHESRMAAAAEMTQLRVLAALPGVADVDSPVCVTIAVDDGTLVCRLVEACREAAMIVVGEPQSAEHLDLPETLAMQCGCSVIAVSERSEIRWVSHGAHQSC